MDTKQVDLLEHCAHRLTNIAWSIASNIIFYFSSPDIYFSLDQDFPLSVIPSPAWSPHWSPAGQPYWVSDHRGTTSSETAGAGKVRNHKKQRWAVQLQESHRTMQAVSEKEANPSTMPAHFPGRECRAQMSGCCWDITWGTASQCEQLRSGAGRQQHAEAHSLTRAVLSTFWTDLTTECCL